MSSSKSNQSSTTHNSDERQIADNGGLALNVSSGSDTVVHMVPDEAFDLANNALYGMQDLATNAMGTTADFAQQALNTTAQEIRRSADMSIAYARTETTQLADKLIKIGIPAAVIVFLATKLK